MTTVNFPFDTIRDELGLPFHLASAPNIAKDGVTASRYQVNYWIDTLSKAGVREIVVNRYDYVIEDNLTIPAGLTLRFTGGGRLKIASGKTVTVNGRIINENAGNWHDEVGTVVYGTDASSEKTVTVSGNEDALESGYDVVRITTSDTTPTIRGITEGQIGQHLSILNDTANTIPINQDDANALVTRRIHLPDATFDLEPNHGASRLVYGGDRKWWQLGGAAKAVSAPKAQLPVNMAQLRLYWENTHAIGNPVTSITDQSVYGNDGTAAGIPVETGDSVQFDGFSDYIDHGADASLDITGGNVSVEMWLKGDDFGGAKTPNPNQHFVWKGGALPSSQFTYSLQTKISGPFNNTYMKFRVGFTAGSLESTDHSDIQMNQFTPGVWYHIVGTYDGVTLKLYVDSVEMTNANTAGVGTLRSLPTDALGIGGRVGGADGFFDGDVGRVTVWARTLDQADITELYNFNKRK